jgi:hypothetical protein
VPPPKKQQGIEKLKKPNSNSRMTAVALEGQNF